MNGDGNNRWIVLLNKSPKGPLAEDEIRALLEKGILRRNDIAYRIPANSDTKAQTEWKLIWQFPEFDRRGDQPAAKPAAPVAERRIEPALNQSQTLTDIPVDLLNIAPEDLLPKSTAFIHLDREPDLAPEAAPTPRPEFEDFEGSARTRWIFGSAATALVCAVGWMLYPAFFQSRSTPSTATPAPLAMPERIPAAGGIRATARPPGPSATSSAPVASRRTPEDAPLPTHEPEVMEADQGEVPEEERQPAEDGNEEPRDAPAPRPRDPRDRPNMGAGRRQPGSNRKLPLMQNDDQGVDDGRSSESNEDEPLNPDE